MILPFLHVQLSLFHDRFAAKTYLANLNRFDFWNAMWNIGDINIGDLCWRRNAQVTDLIDQKDTNITESRQHNDSLLNILNRSSSSIQQYNNVTNVTVTDFKARWQRCKWHHDDNSFEIFVTESC